MVTDDGWSGEGCLTLIVCKVGGVGKDSIITERERHCCFLGGSLDVDMLRRPVPETQPGKSVKEGVGVLASVQISRKLSRLGELLGYHIEKECGCECMTQM